MCISEREREHWYAFVSWRENRFTHMCIWISCKLWGISNSCIFLIYHYCLIWQNMLQTGLIVGGWDKYEGGKIYGIPLGGTIIEQPFAIGGMFSCLQVILLYIFLLHLFGCLIKVNKPQLHYPFYWLVVWSIILLSIFSLTLHLIKVALVHTLLET